ncbi:MAG: Xaa-Pro peptidase family protein [Thaumarchaeota archaeon]|nr:Xaa-Pro peptidase family protein [Nitrososphaerota archaeon]
MFLNKDRAFSIMDKYGLDALVATTPANVTYLSDFRALGHEILGSYVFVVLPRDKKFEPAIILSTGESADLVALNMSWIKDVRTFGSFFVTVPKGKKLRPLESRVAKVLAAGSAPDAFQALTTVIREKGLAKGKVGVDEKYFSPADWPMLQKALAGTSLVPAYDIFREIRMVKTPEQVEVMRKANQITEEGIKEVLERTRPGVTGVQLQRIFIDKVTSLGATCVAPSIALGEDSYLQNMFVPSTHRLERGDLIRFDVGCIYKYHYTDLGRNAVLGKPSATQRKYYKVVYEGEDSALKKLRAGVKASDVFNAGVEGGRKGGLPNFRRHHTGHGIGMELYEPPLIAASTETAIPEGAVINIETPYYEIGAGGYMVEDTVLVKKSGVEFFSKFDRDLYEIPI